MILLINESPGCECREWLSTYSSSSAENRVPLARRLEPGATQEEIRGAIEHHNEGIQDVVEKDQRPCDPQGNALRLLDSQRLRREFTEDDVEEGDRSERNTEAQRMPERDSGDTKLIEERFQPPREKRLAEPAEPEARQGDSQLRGREARIQVFQGAQGDRHAPIPGFQQRSELAVPHLDDGKLSSNEKAVGKNKKQDDKDLPSQVEKRHGRNCGVNVTPLRLNRRWRKCNA